jgi:hypothetical protein
MELQFLMHKEISTKNTWYLVIFDILFVKELPIFISMALPEIIRHHFQIRVTTNICDLDSRERISRALSAHLHYSRKPLNCCGKESRIYFVMWFGVVFLI